jgi:hypothetical protein
MVGPDGIRGEFLKGLYTVVLWHDASTDPWYEKHVYDLEEGSVLSELCELLNGAFGSSVLPGNWSGTFLSAIFKKGDPSVLDNYRGIAVGSVVGKVFSLVLHARLSAWSEEQGCRAVGQAGFRDGYRTCDHVFVLKHLVNRARCPAQQRLFTCFVDFRV